MPPVPEQLYELYVACEKVISRTIKDEVRTAPSVWIVGEIPASSALHARNIYWATCKHARPELLDEAGQPLRETRLRFRELKARLKPHAGGNP